MRERACSIMFAVVLPALVCVLSTPAIAAERIVSIGGSVTEILFALGAGDQLVAVDATSIYPPAADALPDVGYLRALAPEPILALKPDLVLCEADAGPPETLAQLHAAGTATVMIPDEPSAAGVAAKIRAVAETIGRSAAGEELVASLERDLSATAASIPRVDGKQPRVLFVLQFDEGSVMAAGRGTSADAIITLAGGINAAAAFNGYKAMNGEALLATAPDYILTMERAIAGLGSHDAVLALPAVRLTPAAKAGRLVVMDGLLLLGFGPRLGLATRQLADAIYATD